MSRENSSFTYKTINKQVRQVLEARSQMDNTVQMAMPFVKATTTIGNMSDILQSSDNVGFTLGIHGYPNQDITTEAIYSPGGGDAWIGYTYKPNGDVQPIYANLDTLYMSSRKYASIDIKKMISLLNVNTELAETTSKIFVPPPGITSATITRNRAGVVSTGTINFVVPTLPQLELLHRTFLIPGCGMILEWGQQFADDGTNSYGESGLRFVNNQKIFPWTNKEERDKLFEKIRLNRYGFPDILTDYVWPTQGQYMWMFGRIANFDVKSNADGSYNCMVKISGPAEESWAYSVTNTALPPKDLSGTVCVEDANSVATYFGNTTDGFNLKSLLEDVLSKPDHAWHAHVVKFEKPPGSEGEPAPDSTEVNLSEDKFFNTKDSYFFTWRFFVNVVLNDEEVGVKAIFKKAGFLDEELKKIALLLPYADGPNREITGPVLAARGGINDPFEPFVGYNDLLRSIDPGTMIIVNDAAVFFAKKYVESTRPPLVEQLFKDTPETTKMRQLGSFTISTNKLPASEKSTPIDKGFLSTGVWLNHKAVSRCMVGADTVIMGISNLLQNMSSATSGFWQLALDIANPNEEISDQVSYNYSVIDINYRENSNKAVEKLLKNGENKIHIFNKFIRNDAGNIVGSDVIDCSVDLALPKRMFSQIATLGLVQPKDIQTAGGQEVTEPDSPTMNTAATDTNEALREMFAITSISPKDGKSVDITMPNNEERKKWFAGKTCGKVESSTTAGTGGANNSAAPPPTDAAKAPDDLKKEIEDLEKQKEAACKDKTCPDPVIETPVPTAASVPNANEQPKADRRASLSFWQAGYRNGEIPNSVLSTYQGKRFVREVADSLEKLEKRILTDTGTGFTVTSGYRSFQEQANLVSGGNQNAAKPGTSSHGWGTGVDIRRTSILTDWFEKNSALVESQFGFKRTYTPKGTNPPIHLEYMKPISITPAPRPREQTAAKDLTTPTPTVSPTTVQQPVRPSVDPACAECNRVKSLLDQKKKQLAANNTADARKDQAVKLFPEMEAALLYVELFPEWMISNIRGTADGNSSNAFGASPGTLSIKADITLPGVNGLRVGELFWLDRIPMFYRVFGAFQIINITDTIDISNGWTTKIESRFNYLGAAFRDAMIEQFKEPTDGN
jgi:hypothetical protein